MIRAPSSSLVSGASTRTCSSPGSPPRTSWYSTAGFEISPRYGILVSLRKPLVESLGQLHAHRVDGSYTEALRKAGLPLP